MTHLLPVPSFSPRALALTAGTSLVVMALMAGIGYGYAFQGIYVPNSPATTLQQLHQHGFLLRLVLGSFLLVLLLDVVVAWALRLFFAPVHGSLALLMGWLRLAYAALLAVALLPLVGVQQLLVAEPHHASLAQAGLKAFLGMWSVGLVVFGFHLAALGWLMLQTAGIPRALGWLMCFVAVCYTGCHAANLLWAGYGAYQAAVEAILGLPMALAELGLAGWLLWRGGKTAG